MDDKTEADVKQLQSMKESQILAMEAIFNLCEAMDDDLTTQEVLDVMRLAIEDGHETMAICLAMVNNAMSRLLQERKSPVE
jgi:hypothetical protein